MHVLSGGEMQHRLLARALLRDPHILVLDEPLQGVDPKGQKHSMTICAVINKKQDVLFCLSPMIYSLCTNQATMSFAKQACLLFGKTRGSKRKS